MDNLDLLSDDELRRRLLQYGFPNLPITQTTRKTLIKKLRNHLASTNNNLRKTTSLVTRYSSGEESDTNDKAKSKGGKKANRMTVSGTPLPPLFNSYQTPPRTSNFSPPASAFNRSGSNSSGKNVYVSPVIIDSEDDDLDWSARKNRSSNNNSFTKNIQSRSSILNRNEDLYNSVDTLQKNVNGSNGYENDEEEEDPNLTSNYTRRLLQFREGNLQKTQNNLRKRPMYSSQRSDYQQPPVNENDIVYHAEPFVESSHIPLNMVIKNFINRLDAAYGFKQTLIPMILVTFLIVFFALIIFMYITISPDIENTLNTATTSYVVCDQQHESEESFTCIDEQNLSSSMNLLKTLASELQSRAVNKKCAKGSVVATNVMCVKDIRSYLSENQLNYRKYFNEHTSVLDVMKDVHNIEYLIEHNKQWGIFNVNENGEPMTLDEVVTLRAHQAECFAILSPKLPITCTLMHKFRAFFTIIGTLGVVALLFFIIRKFYYFVLHVKEKRRAQVNQIINEIIRMLMEKTVTDKENAFLVINHLRDKIIEPSKKAELMWAWQEAITYLENNDSRIHFGSENINGEDFKIIRWIDDVKNLSGTQQPQQPMPQQQTQRLSTMRYNIQPPDERFKIMKKWQCPAFDKSNKIKDPPTNCLKIRQMFEKYEANNPNLQTVIQDTILHKVCEKGCKIFDIQLDVKSCCVYVKCATSEDAGIVHEEINGWWLDNRLVVVKFLKQEKYHQRFPSSINACSVMYPSSNYISMGSHYSELNGQEFGEDDIDDDENDDFD